MKRSLLLVLGLMAILVGFLGLATLESYQQPTITPSYSPIFGVFSSSGERIYFTAIGDDGPIPFEGGPRWLWMRGGSCASCHGVDGQGGQYVMMSDQVAPAITFKALTEEEHQEGETEAHPPWDEELIRRGITEGLDPAGEPLDSTMPRWDMSEGELDGLMEFLKTLDK
ncbi:MAG: c-type cytochrome [Actinomycetota bacterium]|nr:c-type cytochrome [Actinomycetota bacterium]